MVPNPTLSFVTLILGVSTFIIIMLLPALLELKRPKDAGPRIIRNTAFSQYQIRKLRIINVEEDQKFDHALVKKIADAIAFLPNLET